MFVFGLTKSFKRLPIGNNCISNTLKNGHIAYYNTKFEDRFFNRKQELAKFTSAFSANPEFHVILGPPSTGKTTLIRELTSKERGIFNAISINCRKGQFDTPKRIYDSIYLQFSTFIDEHKDLLDHILKKHLGANYNGFNIIYDSDNKKVTSNEVTKLLDDISNFFPKWTFWNEFNIPPPVLVIDEANMFNQLVKKEENLLKSILNWMVLNTKEEKRFHVVLTSSDSFFFDWILNFLQIPHATPYVVGDLSKEEGEEYFENHVLPQYECKELEGKFDRVCRITGTRMLIIDRYVKEYKIYGGKLKDSNFSIYESEYGKLRGGLYPKELRYSDKNYPPRWESSDLIQTMKAIVKAKDQGFILENDLIEAIGPAQVNSLVEYNFLHRRPTSRFANDIVNPPDTKIILTAMNQPSVRAMEQVLSEENKNNTTD